MNANPRNSLDTVPMFRFSVVFVIGVLLSSLLDFSWWFYLLCGFTCVALLSRYLSQTLYGLALLLGIVCAGGVRMQLSEMTNGVDFGFAGDRDVRLSAVVVTEPRAYGKVMFMEALAYGDSTAATFRGKRMVLAVMRDTVNGSHEGIHVGSRLCGMMRVSALADNAYNRWLKTNGVVMRCFAATGRWRYDNVEKPELGFLQELRLRAVVWRERVIGSMRQAGMSGDEFEIAVAMSLGYKTMLSREVRHDFRYTGASHILAVSGTHIAMLFMLLRLVFRVKRRYLLPAVWMYVLFVGMPMSAVRAATMVTLLELSVLLGRRQRRLNIFGATLGIMVAVDPESLWDVGFQLSFAAVLFIMLLVEPLNGFMPDCIRHPISYSYRALHPLLSRLKDIGWSVWGVLVVGFAAQLGTSPLTMHYFGTLPLSSLVISVIVVPAAAVVIPLTLVCALLSGLGVPLVTGWLWLALRLVVGVVYGCVQFVASLPFSYMEGMLADWFGVVVAYIGVLAFAWVLNRVNSKPERFVDTTKLPF